MNLVVTCRVSVVNRMTNTKYLVYSLIVLILIAGIVSSAEAKSKTFKLKVNIERASSLDGKIRFDLFFNTHSTSKTVNVGKLAQQLDKSEIFGKASFNVKKSWIVETLGRGDWYTLCAHSLKIDAQKCVSQQYNHKSSQTILIQMPQEGDHDDVDDL
jgi:hypothetical protein